jgi:hypothetical protein
MSRASGTLGKGRWSLIALLLGTAIACSSSSESSSRNVPDGSTEAKGGSAGDSASGGAGGFFSSGGAAGTGGFDFCLSCGGAFGTGGRSGNGGATGGAAGAGAGGVPAFCATPMTEWLPAMKVCRSDADCQVVPTFSCCGPGLIYGVATTSVPRVSQCLTTSPPQGCPALGCASQARTEDDQSYQPPNYGDLSGVQARCVDTAGGTKECTSTLRGSCIHNATRCAAGNVCSNPCGANCTCQNGYVDCPRPTGTCPATSVFCEYRETRSTPTVTRCTCPSPGAPWSCSP